MSKNNKGYLLTETIIGISVVATVITVVYTMSLGNYKMQDIELTKANTAQEVYTAKELRKFLYSNENNYINQIEGKNYKQLFAKNGTTGETPENELMNQLSSMLDVKYIYISEYNLNPLIRNENFNSQIKNLLLKKEDSNENRCSYRYLIIYNNNGYSTIGIRCEGTGD